MSIKNHIKQFDFKKLFMEMGWDNHAQRHQITIDDNSFSLSSIAEKRGVQILICTQIPNYLTRKKIETKISELVYEHLIIFTDEAQTRQIWQWVARLPHKPTAYREYSYQSGQSAEVLSQKLEQISFTLDEEESLTLTNVTEKLKDSFDKEKLTKRFYDQFKKEHAAFLAFIAGIPDVEMQRWYASLMINRLMFIYFIQYKGFLHHPQFPNDDAHYLQQQLNAFPQRNYYRDFLTSLFFDGFAKQQHTPEIKALIGDIPYLNGSLFISHKIEEKYGKAIEIPNAAFARLFEFFDKWHWHLDDNPIKNDNEINPDVLGYIFEKYINQKQMGAYYTKEDITEYISKNTILPYLFTVAQQKCKIAFQGENSIWQLLPANPNRYIYSAVRHGIDLDLPPEIAAGITDVAKRTNWNQSATADYALPTEIWREVVARRSRYQDIYAKLANGEIQDINDFLTYNLDIRQFAQDVIENAEGPELVRAFWVAIVGRVPTQSNQSFQQGLTVLDPTCGSGAFLFAALEILEPLYEACLERMEAFVEDFELLKTVTKKKLDTKKFNDFRQILAQVAEHPNRRYFILKSIIVHNLYGVDIMEEAVEIAKLRLFLKLVAQVDKDGSKKTNFGIEPLPDIDFNLRAGNTLVGFANYDEVKAAVSSKLDFDNALSRIEEKASDVNHLFEEFRRQQTRLGGQVNADDKRQLRDKLAELEAELNQYLARDYGIDLTDKAAVSQWQNSHKPFHWFIEFYGIINSGGFDVVIGNPPYLEQRQVDYSLRHFECLDSKAIHAMCIERGLQLSRKKGSMSMIVPLALVSTQRMQIVQNLLEKQRNAWYANYSWRPGKLFETVNRALTIFIITFSENGQTFSTDYQKWVSNSRNWLMFTIGYIKVPRQRQKFWIPKLGHSIENTILNKCFNVKTVLGNLILSKNSHQVFYRCDGGLYWKVFTNFPPAFFVNGKAGHSTRETTISLANKKMIYMVIAALSSDIFWWWYTITSNCRHLNPYDIQNFPIPETAFNDDQLVYLGKKYLKDLQKNSTMLVRNQKQTGKTETQSFKIQKSKPIIDEIDKILAQHYGFTDEELDFIINYDIKYRMGK